MVQVVFLLSALLGGIVLSLRAFTHSLSQAAARQSEQIANFGRNVDFLPITVGSDVAPAISWGEHAAGLGGVPMGVPAGLKSFAYDAWFGVAKGDFGNSTVGGTLAQVVIGTIPVVAQIASARDVIADIQNVRAGAPGARLGLAASMAGLIPGVGGAAKAAIRLAANVTKDGLAVAHATAGIGRAADAEKQAAALADGPRVADAEAQAASPGNDPGGFMPVSAGAGAQLDRGPSGLGTEPETSGPQ